MYVFCVCVLRVCDGVCVGVFFVIVCLNVYLWVVIVLVSVLVYLFACVFDVY